MLSQKGGGFVSWLTALAIIVPALVSMWYAYLSYRREKEKDEIWETVTKIICSNAGPTAAGEFTELYSMLKLFKDHGCSLPPDQTIEHLFLANSRESSEN